MQHVKIYTKLTCPYCIRAKQLLAARGVQALEEIRIDQQPERREEMMQASGGRHTVPQIFIGGAHIGGCDDLMELDVRGELLPLLNRA